MLEGRARGAAIDEGGGGPHVDDLDLDLEPLVEDARYPPPRGRIDPDTGLGWLRRLLPVVLARRGALGLSLSAALVAMVATVAVPAVTQRAIDRALVDRTDDLEPYVWALAVLAVVRGGMAMGYRYGLFSLAYRIETDLRIAIFEHLSGQSFSFFDRVQSGQLISRANSDIRSVQMFLAFAPLMAMSMLSFVLAVAVMLSIHVGLTVVAVLCLPGVYLLGVRLRNHIFPLSWVIQSRTADLATVVDESINGVRVVKSFAAEQQQLDSLARSAQRLRWASVAVADARARLAPAMENLPRLGLALVLLYGGWLVTEQQLQVGAIVAFSAYVVLLQTPFRLLGFFLMMAQRAKASAERIFEVVDEPVAVTDPPDGVLLGDADGSVELDDVTFGYQPDQPVLRGCTLRVAAGETVAIVGRTGCGKSTVARLVDRFYDVDGGVVRVDGHDVRRIRLPSLRATVGIVLDEPFLFSTSVHDNIALARPGASRAEVEAAARDAQAHEFVKALPEGYDTVVGERGYTLSGGQRQRIALARAVLADPPVLILDDATSAIDAEVEQRIHEALGRRLADRTTIVIAHRLSTIALADRVVLLEDGVVAAEGTHEELLRTEPRYADVLAHLEDPRPATGDDPPAPAPGPAPRIGAGQRGPAGAAGMGSMGLPGGMGGLG